MSEAVSLAGRVNVVVETGAWVCSVGGTPDLVEGSLETLYLILRGRGAGGIV